MAVHTKTAKKKLSLLNKKQMRILILSLIIALPAAGTYAQPKQDATDKNIISTGIGASITGLTVKTLLTGDSLKYSAGSTPVIILGYDHRFANWFSVGGAYSRQNFTFSIDQYIDNNNVLQTNGFNADVSRNHLSLRLLANTPENDFVFYGGLRLGLVWFNSNLSTANRSLKILDKVDNWLSFKRPTAGMLVGSRYTISKGLGATAELNFGAAYFAAIGLNYKF